MVKELIYPREVYWEEKEKNYGRLVVEPLERGFGTTLGNSLRRVLLSSISGFAPTAFKLVVNERVIPHEFTSLEGVLEDGVEVVANVKALKVRLKEGELENLYLKKEGEGEIRAKDLEVPPNVEIVEPEQKILTITDKDTKVEMEIRVEKGKGYVPSEEMEMIGETGWIILDANFSPVEKVSFKVEPIMVEGKMNYEKLILEIYTDGRKSVEEAYNEAVEILRSHLVYLENVTTPKEVEGLKITPELESLLNMSVENLGLSQRALNLLKKAGIETLRDLVFMSEEELKKTKHVGIKTIEEVKKALAKYNLSLGMG